MRLLGLAGLLASLALPTLAQEMLATLTGDIDGDGKPDRVEVRPGAADPDFIDVAVSLSASKRTVRVASLVGAQTLLPSGIDKGELTLAFNWFQGRYKSSTTFVVGMQSGELVVRRYETAVADSITTDKNGVLVRTCKADFVANRTTVDDAPAASPGPPIPFAAWHDGKSVPKACRSLF
jgi:hypothetical protein